MPQRILWPWGHSRDELLDRLGEWRKRRGIEIAARAVGPDRARSEPQVALVHVVFAAGVFVQLLVGFPCDPRSRVRDGPRIKLCVLDERLDVAMVGIRPRPALHDVQRVTVW